MGERAGDGMKSRRKVTEHVEITTEVNDTEAARIEIERTRAHMGETLDHIGERLAPERFKAEAVEAAGQIKEDAIDTATHIKEAAVEAAKQMTEEVIGGVKTATKEAVDKAKSRVRHTRHEIEGVTMPYVDTIRKNPVPAAMVGLGLYWLIQSFEENKRIHQRRRYTRMQLRQGHAETPSYNPYRTENTTSYNPYRATAHVETHETIGYTERDRDMRDKLSDKADRFKSGAQEQIGSLQESASRLKDKASRRIGHYSENIQETAHVARDQFETVLYENPLIVAAAAGAIGLVVGMLLPDTEIENETMGYHRDQLVSGAQEVIEEKASDLKEKANTIKEKAINVARETAAVAADTLKEQAGKEGLVEQPASTPAPSSVGVGVSTPLSSGISGTTGTGLSGTTGTGLSGTTSTSGLSGSSTSGIGGTSSSGLSGSSSSTLPGSSTNLPGTGGSGTTGLGPSSTLMP